MITSGESVRLNLAGRAALDGRIERPHPADSSPDLSASLSVIVPCYNEAPTVEVLLRRVRQALPAAEIIVVDDGSTDGTGEIVRHLKEDLRLLVVACEANRGKGAAFRSGLELVNRTYTVIQDADLEYDPRELRVLLEIALADDLDAVYGSRYLHRGRRTGGARLNYWAVKILGLVLRIKHGVVLSDPATCYKLFRTKLVKSWTLESVGFDLCQELNAHLPQVASFHEAPISYSPRSRAEGRKVCWRDSICTFNYR
ncbi:MAG: dolichyl-phosphate hexose synthase [Pirellulaceae bacterium]|nr:MAG: dolichyl-phosphate hexose synthase [Pirellulaceae bacterium]